MGLANDLVCSQTDNAVSSGFVSRYRNSAFTPRCALLSTAREFSVSLGVQCTSTRVPLSRSGLSVVQLDAPYELRCRKCMKILIGEDLVRKIANQYYHAHCFRCQTCNKMLITGQKYEIHRTKIFCATHMKRQTMPKRKSFNRTIINEVQRKILEKHFAKNKFPTMLETMKICSKTDLSHDAVLNIGKLVSAACECVCVWTPMVAWALGYGGAVPEMRPLAAAAH
ncbi:Arrowhead [Carabus blaptoides fortunei]